MQHACLTRGVKGYSAAVTHEDPPAEPRDTPGEGETPAGAESPRQSTPFLVVQFFLFPLGIVAVCVAVFVIFGMIASEGRSAKDYLDEVRSGSANRRWQAAFELAKVLQAGRDPALKDPRFVDEMTRVFAQSSGDDPRVRRYLALALGRVGDRRILPALLAAVDESAPGGARPDPETHVYTIWALGAVRAPEAAPRLVELSGSQDAGVRKAAVHALGALPGDPARQALVAALSDRTDDVRWNAALALAQRRSADADRVLLEMLDRKALETLSMTDEQREDTLVQAAAAAALVPTPELHAALERLRDQDPSLKVRDAARAARDGRPAPSPGS
jgi:HEAT repeat protein